MANASEFWGNLKKNLTVTADRAVKKTDEIISVQKVKNKKYTLEKQVDTTYRSIGKMIFDEYTEGSPISEDLAKLCEKIKKLQKEIEACREEIADIKGEAVSNSRGPVREDDIEDAEYAEADPEDEAEEAVVEDEAEESVEEAEPVVETAEEVSEGGETEE